MPATSWTEASGSAATYFEGIRAPISVSGFALFGMPIPIVDGIAYLDPTESWTEASGSAASWAKPNQSATSWTEAT